MKKIDRAVEIARGILRENPEINDTLLRTKVKEAVPCERTTAYKAVNKVRRESREHAKAEEPHIETIKPLKGAKTPEIEPIGEIEEPLIPPETIEKPIVKGEPEILDKMLQRVHVFFLHDVLEEWDLDVSEKEAKELGAMCFSVAENRVGIETLRKYDVAMLGACYMGIVLKIGAKIWKKRRKKKQKPKENVKPKTS